MARDLALEKEWKIRHEEYKKSGLSIKAWCTKNGFKPTTFQYWIKRFKVSEPKAPLANAQFAEVILESGSMSSTVIKAVDYKKLYLSYGNYTINIADGFNSNTLLEVLKVLQSL